MRPRSHAASRFRLPYRINKRQPEKQKPLGVLPRGFCWIDWFELRNAATLRRLPIPSRHL
ncbi:hypothetical protein GCWU000324_01341 [Kingella oralis ATCC 51147]|uniref:Uncharacterized protein n=1 Tax=Kingella oralis ATCC 51147 TaxID=629741 RepID=C4GGS1_9NEIS|nr:hypothetical protein GCWU000324_01341 [Kingella oralis ATCC 51147]